MRTTSSNLIPFSMVALAFASGLAAQGGFATGNSLASRIARPGAAVVTAQLLAAVGQSGASLRSAIQSNPLAVLGSFYSAVPGASLLNPLRLTGGAGPSATCNPLLFSFDRDPAVYAPGEPATFIAAGAVGTPAVVFWDTDPGPTFIPGLGNLHIGFSPGFFAEVVIVPAVGPFLEPFTAPCFTGSPTPVYVHGFTIEPATMEVCLSNPISALFLPCGQGCVYTQGYWKTHPCNWPAPFTPAPSPTKPNQCSVTGNKKQWCTADTAHSIHIGARTYDQAQLLCVFERSSNGNALVILAHQLIAAKLNILNGGKPPAGTVLSDAMLAVGSLDLLTDVVLTNSSLGAVMVALAGNLDDYNNGRSGASHCD